MGNAEQHTPGPWHFGPCSEHMDGTVRACFRVRAAGNHPVDFTAKDADGHLAAAAPDLLDACRAVLARFDLEPADAIFPGSAMRDYLRAAIARATQPREHLADDVAKPHESAASPA